MLNRENLNRCRTVVKGKKRKKAPLFSLFSFILLAFKSNTKTVLIMVLLALAIAPGIAICNDADRIDRTGLREEVLEFGFSGFERQISNVEFLFQSDHLCFLLNST